MIIKKRNHHEPPFLYVFQTGILLWSSPVPFITFRRPAAEKKEASKKATIVRSPETRNGRFGLKGRRRQRRPQKRPVPPGGPMGLTTPPKRWVVQGENGDVKIKDERAPSDAYYEDPRFWQQGPAINEATQPRRGGTFERPWKASGGKGPPGVDALRGGAVAGSSSKPKGTRGREKTPEEKSANSILRSVKKRKKSMIVLLEGGGTRTISSEGPLPPRRSKNQTIGSGKKGHTTRGFAAGQLRLGTVGDRA